MAEKSAIDRVREGALSMRVGDQDDPSALTDMLSLGDQLFVVKESGVYEIRLADSIDPGRTNIGIPNTQQRVLRYGSSTPFVARTLLTAKRLFNPSYLSSKISCNDAIKLVLQIATEIAAMEDIRAEVSNAIEKSFATSGDRIGADRSFSLPATSQLLARCKDFVQKTDHALQILLWLIKSIYGDDAGRRWFEGFADVIEHKFGADDDFARYLKTNLSFLKFIRNARNCVEHADQQKRMVVADFCLTPEGKLSAPTIGFVHPHTPQDPLPVVSYLAQICDAVVSIVEASIVFVCSKNIEQKGAFERAVIELPEDRRTNGYVRYSYAVLMGDTWTIAS